MSDPSSDPGVPTIGNPEEQTAVSSHEPQPTPTAAPEPTPEQAAEKRIESKVEEMKSLEGKAVTAAGQRNEQESARFKGIITMYEGMKPKDAAKVFDRLEMGVLIEIASQIAPRKMSDILGLMQPEAAERLTVELARRASGDNNKAAELPKIEGRMLNQKSN